MCSPCTCCAPPHQFMWQALQLSTRYTVCLSLVITFHRVNCTVYMGRQWVAQPNAYEAPPRTQHWGALQDRSWSPGPKRRITNLPSLAKHALRRWLISDDEQFGIQNCARNKCKRTERRLAIDCPRDLIWIDRLVPDETPASALRSASTIN